MKTANYKLAGDIPEQIRSTKEKTFTIETRESESLDDMHLLVENGSADNVRKLAQGQYDIIVQRKIREYLASEEVVAILAGKTVGEGDGAEDFAAHTDDERVAEVLKRAQDVADNYVYGSRAPSTGGASKAGKDAITKTAAIAAAAAADPELAAKLAGLGITL